MPTVRIANTVAIGATVANALAGNQFEFIAVPSQVQVYWVQDTADLGEIEIFFGQELQFPAAPIPIAAAGLGPVVPDDILIDDIAAPGDRLVLRLTETGGAATAVTRGLVKITPLG